VFALAAAVAAWAGPEQYFAVKVVDTATGRGVPLVELRAVNDAAWWTDSAGLVAFDEPGLMDTEVYLQVQSPGYEYPADGFGYRGVRLRPVRGGTATIQLKRLNVAERLYRVTGAGIYRDSVLLGRPAPTRQPLLNAQVLGQDTVIATPYRGKIYWFWGDTNRVAYPLGHFGAAGATSEWPGRGGLDPAVGVDLTYFVGADGFSRPVVPEPSNAMRWILGVTTVPDETGIERLVASVAHVKELGYAFAWYLMMFDDERGVFTPVRRWEVHDPHQSAHPFRARVGTAGYCYWFPELRVRADLRSLTDLANYEAFTCVVGDGRWRGPETMVDRDPAGRVRWAWKAGADHLRTDRLNLLVKQGKLRAEESWQRLTDFETGKPLARGLESVAWNEHRQRWIAFLADRPGEAWFAEADTPVGPWGYARRVVTHGAYNFYNLAHHSFFDQEGGRRVYFEGTYTDSFSAARARTPRYNYNQLMYRLDLADERLQLPVAVYRVRNPDGATRLTLREQVAAENAWERIEEVAFFALPPECRRAGTVPVFAVERGGAAELTLVSPGPEAQPLFVALPAEASAAAGTVASEWSSPALAGLRPFRPNRGGEVFYAAATEPPAGCEVAGPALCRVWRAPNPHAPLDWRAEPAPATPPAAP
jgi:hypothetical protein